MTHRPISEEEPSKLAELAKQHRVMLHLTQEQYAKRFGFESATACSLWEAGKRQVPNKVLESVLGPLPAFQICPTCQGRGMLEIEAMSQPASPTDKDPTPLNDEELREKLKKCAIRIKQSYNEAYRPEDSPLEIDKRAQQIIESVIDQILAILHSTRLSHEAEVRIATIGEVVGILAFENIPLSNEQFKSLKIWQAQLEAQLTQSTKQET